MVTTTLLALPMALRMDSASWKVTSTALMRSDSSLDSAGHRSTSRESPSSMTADVWQRRRAWE
ncbi:hypothetical protein RHMOL_Rhmol08G0103800 [Rhododendron molle]|uniref:Uncharacterized protein n=1 Tax=Rhododendron molle TaxID=49168 RepID=A0ACC0MMY7_RHOML|nr:hypothetical protein RHMOL_Rhmol08G0103800 [Rhododendron molle]